ncbi:hypothetical protein BDB00DRAFT_805999 [Zychaea mexicana]|uniref:uncharacterized protein n=1 Tax=Zychaea mexicana TaxID=64656 RepID=UPI0022FE9A15|nr:uncharacterized protein BDB00DRAFT_805999 [Zychaea mexicana]KAI9497324.1 hypothetical protein BDB00DRAFT_805999 [Zychaea mexicana]
MACLRRHHHRQRSLLERLPSEILWHIFSFASPRERCAARTVSRQLYRICSHPKFWQSVALTHASLWQLDELRHILTPHLQHIRSLSVQGVRDETLRFLLNHCPNLQELSVHRWRTLSDHALQLDKEHLGLRSFALHGDNTPYTAIDANSLAQLLLRLPNLQILAMVAHAHVHIPTLLKAIQKKPPLALRAITLPVYHHEQQYDGVAISSQYGEQLLETCPRLEQVFFVPNMGVYYHSDSSKLNPVLVHHRRILIEEEQSRA